MPLLLTYHHLPLSAASQLLWPMSVQARPFLVVPCIFCVELESYIFPCVACHKEQPSSFYAIYKPNVADPAQLSQHKQGLDALKICLRQDLGVCDVILAFYNQDCTKTAMMLVLQ